MKAHVPLSALLLALAACASHPPRCGSRLTPINPQPIRSDLAAGIRWAAAHPVKPVQVRLVKAVRQ